MRVEVLAVHPLEMRAGDDVEQVRNDAIGDEHLADVVEIEPPGVRRPVGDGLERLANRVESPDAALIGTRSASGVPGCRRASST